MLLKKFALIGSALAISALPVLANADLITCNHTDYPSTVKVTSSTLPGHPCSSGFKDGVTPAKQCLPGKTLMAVKTICGAPHGGICTAEVYASANCTGTLVGTVSIDLSKPTMNVTVFGEDPHYHIQPMQTAKGSEVHIYSK